INRLALVESSCDLFKQYSEKPGSFTFDIVCTNNEAPLLPEVIPTTGIHFVIGGDVIVYNALQAKYPQNYFSKAGVYFQSYLLKAIAGWNATVLASSNQESRKSLIACVEKLLRLPYEAGE